MRVQILPGVPFIRVRYQRKGYSCGAAAVVNALRCFGRRVSERNVCSRVGTTHDGTTEEGLLQGIRSFGFSAAKYEASSADGSWSWLVRCLVDRPVVVVFQNWQHWVTAIGLSAGRVVVVDSTNSKANKTENGIHVLSRREFMRRWKNTQNGLFSGVCISKR